MRNAIILLIIIFMAIITLSYADDEDIQLQEQRESKMEEKIDQLERVETAKQIIENLKERAMLKILEKRRELFLKRVFSASVLYGFETNTSQSSDTKGDYYIENDLSFYWKPAFNDYLGLNTGFWLVKQDYFEQSDSSSMDSAATFNFVLTPFEDGSLRLEPGFEYEWLLYSKSKESNYANKKYFMKFKHYIFREWYYDDDIFKEWNYGGGYEYSEKTYDRKKARNQEKLDSPDIFREDSRHALDLYTTLYVEKFIFKLKGKGYVNYSNDQYKEYYDYDSIKPSISIARTFLKDDKLYVSFSPSFERKNYHHRTAVNTARYDDITTWAASVNYTLKNPFSLSYKFTYKKQGTNVDTARYKDISNIIGLTASF